MYVPAQIKTPQVVTESGPLDIHVHAGGAIVVVDASQPHNVSHNSDFIVNRVALNFRVGFELSENYRALCPTGTYEYCTKRHSVKYNDMPSPTTRKKAWDIAYNAVNSCMDEIKALMPTLDLQKTNATFQFFDEEIAKAEQSLKSLIAQKNAVMSQGWKQALKLGTPV